jgi:hypothetical protein
MAIATPITKLDNLPVSQIADLLGKLDAGSKALEARM